MSELKSFIFKSNVHFKIRNWMFLKRSSRFILPVDKQTFERHMILYKINDVVTIVILLVAELCVLYVTRVLQKVLL